MGNRPRASTEGSNGFTQGKVEPLDEGGLNGTSQAVHRSAEGVTCAEQHPHAAEVDLAVGVYFAQLTILSWKYDVAFGQA